MRFLIFMSVASVLVLHTYRSAFNPSRVPGGDAQRGRQIFKSYGCYECHDYDAMGGARTGPRLAPNPIPFTTLLAYVRHPTGEMPPYTSKVVSDQELADIYAFLQSIPAPPSPKSIPLLNH